MQGHTIVMNWSYLLFLVALLCASAVLSQRLDHRNGEVENVVELLLSTCRQDLNLADGDLEDMYSFPQVDSSSSNNKILAEQRSLFKENIERAISVLHPQMRQIIYSCLRKRNLLNSISGEEASSEEWYTRYIKFLFDRTDVYVGPTQKLGRELLQTIAPAPSFDPASSSPEPSSGSPSRLPRPSLFPSVNSISGLQSPTGGRSPSPDAAAYVQPHKGKSNHKSVVIAVVVTATVTFALSALLFFCYRKCRKSFVRRNDERPLLTFSLSEFSVASSQKSSPSGSVRKEKYGSTDFNNINLRIPSDGNLNIVPDVLNDNFSRGPYLAANTGAANTGAAKVPIDSTGIPTNMNTQVVPVNSTVEMVNTNYPGQHYLKPPPGRKPSSLRPPPGRGSFSSSPAPCPHPPPPPVGAAPPPPPPPSPPPPPPPPPPSAPPSSRKPSSGGSGNPPVGPPPPPPISQATKSGPRPPPPPKGVVPPSRPPPTAPMGLKASRVSSAGPNHEADPPKTKLKPFFWDKVLANPDHSMVWHQIKSGSFQFDEEMIENLFGYAPANKDKNDQKRESYLHDHSNQYIQLIDSKKAQNLSILLRALNVTTEEVCDALREGNELPVELLETLLKMAPTAEEELKLRLFCGEISQLGPAERFLKVLVEIPFAFKRLESLLFMSSLQEEASIIRESFATLEVACKELRSSRLFLKLLEAVLKTGNRMNDGTFRGGAQAFKLDTLLKLSDVKGTDGKTTLLHFVVQEIIRSEGVRAARAANESRSFSSIKSDDLLEDSSHDSEESYRSLGLQVVSGLSAELESVKRAAALDADGLAKSVSRLGQSLRKAKEFLNTDMQNIDETKGFYQTLKSFVEHAGIDIRWLLEEDVRIVALVKSTADYFHGTAGRDEGLRLFVIVRDFLLMLDKVCREVKDSQKKPFRSQKKDVSTSQPASACSSPDLRQRLFPAIADRRVDHSSSDEDSP